jgi:arylsulfatase A-like enzyme
MIETVDQNVGRILDKLDELEIADRTLVVFNSDNGGLTLNNVTDNTPLRAGKGSTYEGGVRVPLLVRWPGVTRAGSVCDEPVVSIDYFPTIREAVGGEAGDAAGARPDGVSLMPLLADPDAKLARDAIYWHYPHYHPGGSTPYGAVRESDWKLIEFYEDMRVELYNLKDDLGESRNLAESMPERAASLREKLHSWRTATGAQMPSPNPDYDPQKAGRVGDMPAGLARQFRFDPDYRREGDPGPPGEP